MKKSVVVLLMILLCCKLFGYSIEKSYGGVISWDYKIVATNESIWSYVNGTKVYSHTILVRDYDNKINYVIKSHSEKGNLEKYHELINQYTTVPSLKDKLIPELDKKIIDYSVSSDGSWMFCYLSENNDAKKIIDISNEDFYDLYLEKYDSGFFEKEELLMDAIQLFDEEKEFFDFFNTSNWEFYEGFISALLDYIQTESNEEQINQLRIEFKELLKVDESKPQH